MKKQQIFVGTILATVAAGLLWLQHAHAQQGKRKLYKAQKNDSISNVYTDGLNSFMNERLYQQFPALGYRRTIDGAVYDFDKKGREKVIDFGFSDCPPCRAQLPFFIDLSNSSRYADVDFMYISFDDSATIMKDLAGHGPLARLKIFSFDKAYFTYSDKPMLAYGCPTMYFIDRNNIVKAITNGGGISSDKTLEERLKQRWSKYIDSLLTN